MGYYLGDYYRGDYYRGDPLLGGLVKLGTTALKTVVKSPLTKAIPGVGTAVSLGGLAYSAAKAVASKYAQPALPATIPMPPKLPPGTPPPAGYSQPRKTPGFRGAVQRALPGGKTGYEYVKRRRMNVTNARALRRAIRRAQGFAKLARRVLTFTQARAPRGKPVFRRTRRK